MKNFRAYTPTRRTMTVADFDEITASKPERSLTRKMASSGGRNHFGHATNQNIGGGHKRRYRIIDFRRDKRDIPGKVVSVEYDPNRSARIALIQYVDGEKRYIISPAALRPGDQILSGEKAEIKPGNALPLRLMPLGQEIYNIELKPGAGGKMARSAGTFAQLLAKEGREALVRLPSGEIRKVSVDCYAVVGAVGNADHQNVQLGKAGRSRWLGRRPKTRGTAKNPVDHPLGGGQGKTKGGRHPVSRTGVLAKGFKTRNNKRTDKYIVRRRDATSQK